MLLSPVSCFASCDPWCHTGLLGNDPTSGTLYTARDDTILQITTQTTTQENAGHTIGDIVGILGERTHTHLPSGESSNGMCVCLETNTTPLSGSDD